MLLIWNREEMEKKYAKIIADTKKKFSKLKPPVDNLGHESWERRKELWLNHLKEKRKGYRTFLKRHEKLAKLNGYVCFELGWFVEDLIYQPVVGDDDVDVWLNLLLGWKICDNQPVFFMDTIFVKDMRYNAGLSSVTAFYGMFVAFMRRTVLMEEKPLKVPLPLEAKIDAVRQDAANRVGLAPDSVRVTQFNIEPSLQMSIVLEWDAA